MRDNKQLQLLNSVLMIVLTLAGIVILLVYGDTDTALLLYSYPTGQAAAHAMIDIYENN